MIISKQLHRKAISLSAEMINKEKKDFNNELVVQKLQKEIQQLESLHEDKSSGLETFKQEFANLEITYQETLEIVEWRNAYLQERMNIRQQVEQKILYEVWLDESYCNQYHVAQRTWYREGDIVKRGNKGRR